MKMATRSPKTLALASCVFLGALLLAAGVATASETSSVLLGLKVKAVLLEKLGADALHINVDAQADTILLGGMVNKRDTQQLAETVAKSVEGVTAVKNNLKLAEPPKEGPATAAASEMESKVKDAMLAVKLRAALIDKLGSDGVKIGTDAASGTVTLAFPRTMAKSVRETAMETAHQVEGVTKVVTVNKK